MATTTTTLSDTQLLIYTRTRIVSTLAKSNPELYGSIEPRDILSVSLSGKTVQCTLADGEVTLDRSAVIANFWEHRTRTPSFFDYKIWRQVDNPDRNPGVAVGAIDYSILPNKIAVDAHGVRKIYFVSENENKCTCKSWQQLNDNKIEFEKEFKEHGAGGFEVTCKHLKWSQANTKLQALRFLTKASFVGHNPKICVYTFDHKRGLLLYRITYDGVKANGQWFPVDGWKEKPVYGKGGIPTGECWDTLFSALSQAEPFTISRFSHSVAALMNSSRSKN